MAAVTALNSIAYGFSTPAGPKTAPTVSGGAAELKTCQFATAFTGTYAQGTGYSLSLANDVAATIKSELRDGKNITVFAIAPAAPGLEGATNALVMPSGATAGTNPSISGGNATGLLFGPDLATEHAAATMGAFGSPCVFDVLFYAQ